MVLIVVMTIMIIVTHYLLEILFIGLHLVKIKIEDNHYGTLEQADANHPNHS